MDPLRIVFMGTAELSCPILEALLGSPLFHVVGVVTQPDRAKGRDLKVQPSPVKTTALRHNLTVLQPARARDAQFVAELRQFRPDLIAVAAYGQILPPDILELPLHGCVNVHTSLLPKYRGAAPIQWALINGDDQTGVTIMKMDRGLDTGDILTQETTRILANDNAQTLHDRLAVMGADLLVRTIPLYISGAVHPQPQPADGVSHAPKIRKEDGLVDWSQPARILWNQMRGLTPWPGMFTYLPAGVEANAQNASGSLPGTGQDVPVRTHPVLLKLWQAEIVESSGIAGTVLAAGREGVVVACGSGALRITSLQREGGRRMSAGEFLAGHPISAGTLLRGMPPSLPKC